MMDSSPEFRDHAQDAMNVANEKRHPSQAGYETYLQLRAMNREAMWFIANGVDGHAVYTALKPALDEGS